MHVLKLQLTSKNSFEFIDCYNSLSSDAPHCLSLQYHMWGSNMGSFVVYTYSAVRGVKEEFTIAGDQGNQWNNLELDLTLDDSTWVRVTRTLFAKLFFYECIILDNFRSTECFETYDFYFRLSSKQKRGLHIKVTQRLMTSDLCLILVRDKNATVPVST